MAIGQQAAVLDGVRRIFEGGTAAASGPDSLLRRFARTGDEAAFAAIVARHGPMVLAVCRRALRDPHDVEDAFQATFLVFVRRAGSIRDGDALGAWLHGVARRVAVRARAVAARRRDREGSSLAIEPAAMGENPDRTEVVAMVDEEIDRLPERYRRAIVLCDLEGCTQPEAAGRLGWSEGSVRGRLARGREMLKSRLRRRGLVAPAGAIGGLAAIDAASAARLGESLIKAVTARGAEAVSAPAVALARDVLGAMMTHKLMTMAAATLVAAATLAGVGAAVLRSTRADDGPEAKAVPRTNAETKIAIPSGGRVPEPPGGIPAAPRLQDLPEPKAPEPEPADARKIAVGDLLYVEVLEALPGRPLTGERLVRSDGTVSLGFYGDLKVAGLTRREAKVKVVEHLLAFIRPEVLGMIFYNEGDKSFFRLHPSQTDRVVVDDSPTFYPRSRQAPVSPSGAPLRPAVSPASAPVPMVFGPGDFLVVEVLEGLPGRPVTGERVVRPDGTISMGFYGDLKVSGLTREQTKVKVIEHLRRWLSDEVLGLAVTGEDGTTVRVPPERSASVYVDETGVAPTNAKPDERIDALEHKLDRVLQELEALRKERSR